MNMRGDAQISARGFQPYEGPRSGVAGAIRSVSVESVRATLGLGRPARTKIFPVAAVAIAYVPAIVFVGISVLIPGDLLDPNEVADYASYYGFITLAIILFSALVAPEVLVSDRRNGMLAMYLSTPLHRGTYLTSKMIAVGVTLEPGHARTADPRAARLHVRRLGSRRRRPTGSATLFRILVSGIAVSAALTSVSMAASSLTDRRAFAAIGIVLIVLASPILAVGLGRRRRTVAELVDDLAVLDAVRAGQPDLRRGRRLPGAVDASRWSPPTSCGPRSASPIVVWRYSKLVIAR